VIIKSLSRKSSNSGALIQYILRYALQPEKNEKFIKANAGIDRSKLTLRHNIRARSLKGIVREFEKNESFRLIKRRDSVRLYHTVLSLSNKDRKLVNENILHDLAQKYVSLRGLNNLYVAAPHFDKGHAHIHIVHSGTALDGRSSRISKQQFHSLKLNLDRYQQEKYPFLVNSLPDHHKRRRLKKESIVKLVQTNRQTKKQDLLSVLDRICGTAKSKEEFFKQLQEEGHQVYFRNGREQGIIVEDVKFRFNRLGFDEERLNGLDQSKYLLREMEELRQGNAHQVVRGTLMQSSSSTKPASVSMGDQALQEELADLRNRRNGRDTIQGRDDPFERDRYGQPTLFDQ
jgi:hypothetical protein